LVAATYHKNIGGLFEILGNQGTRQKGNSGENYYLFQNVRKKKKKEELKKESGRESGAVQAIGENTWKKNKKKTVAGVWRGGSFPIERHFGTSNF